MFRIQKSPTVSKALVLVRVCVFLLFSYVAFYVITSRPTSILTPVNPSPFSERVDIYKVLQNSSLENLREYQKYISDKLGVEEQPTKVEEQAPSHIEITTSVESSSPRQQSLVPWKATSSTPPIHQILKTSESFLENLDHCDKASSLPINIDEYECPQCLEMVCLEQCEHDGEWCQSLDYKCVTASEIQLADSIQHVISAQLHPPAPRCHFSAFDPYPGSLSTKERHTNEVLDLVIVYVSKLETARSSSQRCSDVLKSHRPFAINQGVDAAMMSPAMWPDELEFLVKLMINMSPEVYVEYGSGGSTNFYPLLAQRAYSIEHDQHFCGKSANEGVQQCLTTQKRLQFLCMLGSNTDKEKPFEEYVKAIDRIPEQNLDLVLVDGRARGACALYALHRISGDSVLIIHDFMVRYQKDAAKYKLDMIFDYYELIGRTRTIAAFRKRKNLPAGWRDAWKRYLDWW